MDANLSDHGSIEKIQKEHEELRSKLAQIHHALPQGAGHRAEIESQLRDLRDALALHFEHEEHEGFFDDITERAPRLNPQADKLCTEHEQMLQTAGKLAQLASAETGGEAWLTELHARFREFSKQLMHHESEENALLQQAFQEDIGAHD
jgi:iron-sulfur cluster repair protein YtfE (RIC family)